MKNKTTTLRISVDLHDRLAKLGKKGETFEEIIRKLISDEK